jgi:hypothetical protein
METLDGFIARARKTLRRLESAENGYRLLKQQRLVREALTHAERARDAHANGDHSAAVEHTLAAGVAYGQSWTLAAEATVLMRGQDVGRTAGTSRRENQKVPGREVLEREYYDLLESDPNKNPYKVLADRYKVGESAVRKALANVLKA